MLLAPSRSRWSLHRHPFPLPPSTVLQRYLFRKSNFRFVGYGEKGAFTCYDHSRCSHSLCRQQGNQSNGSWKHETCRSSWLLFFMFSSFHRCKWDDRISRSMPNYGGSTGTGRPVQLARVFLHEKAIYPSEHLLQQLSLFFRFTNCSLEPGCDAEHQTWTLLIVILLCTIQPPKTHHSKGECSVNKICRIVRKVFSSRLRASQEIPSSLQYEVFTSKHL